MTAREAAAALAEIALLLEVVGGNPFRARAFEGAARRLETSGADLAELAAQGRLASLPGVGAAIATVLGELVVTGTSLLLEELRAGAPAGLRDLMRVRGLGARRLRTLHAGLGIDSLETLEAAASAGRIAALPGFGPATERKLLDGAAFVRASRGRRRWFQGWEAATGLVERVRSFPGVSSAAVAGALRRRVEVVDAIVVVAAAEDPRAVVAAFRASVGGDTGSEAGRADAVLSDGLAVTLRCVEPASYATALLVATGSDAHLERLREVAAGAGLRLDAAGVSRNGERLPTPDEASIHAALGLAWIPPELREGCGEVEAAAEGRLPELIAASDLRGTFHCHTTDSDGRASLEEMAEAARERGWSYLGIADHSRAATYAGGLTPSAVRDQQRRIARYNRERGGRGAERFRLLAGIEADILADGSLDYDDALLATFDYVVGSVHSGFGMSERAMTDRLLRAVANPRLTILGHATGRILLRRDGYAVDLPAVLDAAAHHGVAVEINADPSRLDVDGWGARYAASRGAAIAIDPDAHSAAALDHVAFGIDVARRAWLTRADVVNTLELEGVEAWLGERKQKGAP